LFKPLHWAAFGAALIGVSCAGPQPAPEPPAPAPKEAAQPAPAPAETPPAPALAARPAPKPKPPPPRIKPTDLIGLTQAELAKVLGPPAFKRIDDPAALWQYRGTRCILDLFLYADGPVYRVNHVEFRRREGTLPDGTRLPDRETARCFGDFLAAAKVKELE